MNSLANLNTEQKFAVTHTDGPCLIIAGAGTGKTKVLTARVVHLIQTGRAKPEEILALTFTDKATQEMEERIDLMLPLSYPELWIKTFHSFCDQILREKGIEIGLDPGYKILTEPDLLLFMKKNLFNFSLDYFRPLGNPSKFILNLISFFSKLKDENISPHDYLTWANNQRQKLDINFQTQPSTKEEQEILELEVKKQLELASVYQEFQTKMIAKNQLDYGDLIAFTIKLFQTRPNVLYFYQHKFKYILIDEYQDTNFAQNELIRLLAQKHSNLMVVGDDDQAIYRFRGASVTNILKFKEQYPQSKQVVLTKNYRSQQDILDLAYHSIQGNNPERLESLYSISKNLESAIETLLNEPPLPPLIEIHTQHLEQEIDQVINKIIELIPQYQFQDIAILARAKAHLKPFYEALVKAAIPVKLNAAENYKDKKIIKDLLSILRILAYPHDQTSWFRVLKMPVWDLPMENILFLFSQAKSKYLGIWALLQNSSAKNQKEFKLRDFYQKMLELSRDHNVTEVLFNGILDYLQLFKQLEKNENEESLANIQAISKLLSETQNFVNQHDEPNVKAFMDYLDLTEEAKSNPSNQFLSDSDQDAVTLSTVHGAKGLEYKIVFVINLVNDRFPSRRQTTPLEIPESLKKDLSPISEIDHHLMEERRLFYVACTRAKEQLFFTWSDYQGSDSKRKSKKSIFLTELEGKNINLKQAGLTISAPLLKTPPVTHQESPSLDLQINNQKIPTFSYSHLSVYQLCPKRYQYQYVFKIHIPPSAALNFGTTLHNTLSEFYKVINNKQTSLFTEENNQVSLDKLLGIYEKNWIPSGYKSKGHMLARKKRGTEILTEYYRKFSDYFGNPLHLEKSFTLKIGDIIVKGRFDRVDSLSADHKIVEIFDYKTGKVKLQKEVDTDLQLSIYALAAKESLGKEVEKLSLYFLDENIKVETSRTEADLEKAKQKIIMLVDGIKAKNYQAKPNKIICAGCDFRHICDQALT